MILIELGINATTNYLSLEGAQLTHFWEMKVVSFDPPQRSIQYDFGGYCTLRFGSISFAPDLFGPADWPPPATCDITVYWADRDAADPEATKTTLFVGTAQRTTMNRERINYQMLGTEYDETVAGATAYNDDLDTVLDTILTGIAEISTLDTTYARVAQPNCTYTTVGAQLSINLASEIAAFYSHMFYISGSTAYLVDMKLAGGSSTITEFDFFPQVRYDNFNPVATASCTVVAGTFVRTSASAYGQEITVQGYHTTEANINTALDDIIIVLNKDRCSIPMIMASTLPAPGEKVSWSDTAMNVDSDCYVYARIFRYDYMNEIVTIEGEGVFSAT